MVSSRDAGTHGRRGGSTPHALEKWGKGDRIALLMLSTDRIFSYFLPTFVLHSGSIFFYTQEFIICHKMQLCL